MYIKKPFEHDEPVISAAERRTIKRRHLIYYLRVWDTASNRLLGHLADVSSEGFMLVGEEKIPSGQDFELEIRLPASADEMEALRFKAMSRWSSNDVNKLFFDSGFLFTDISDATLQRVTGLIDDYGFND
ncbi:MAG: PilZ domain-containing protein [Chromatiales bacterium]|jgi:hypothetical protein